MMTIDQNACIGCGACARACPMHIFRMTEGRPETRNEKACMHCYHCTAACPQQCVHCEELAQVTEYPPAATDPVVALVTGRRSVRHFRDTPPDRQVLLDALSTAEYAPSGKNDHKNHWAVLYGSPVVERAYQLVLDWCRETGTHKELLFMARNGKNPVTCGAPCVLVGYCDMGTSNPMVDTAIAGATAELLLVHGGLSTCWGGYFCRAANDCPALRGALGIPENSKAICVLLVGYADGENYQNLPYRPQAKTHWITEL